MKVTRIAVTNYRGIEALTRDVGESGAVIKGRNGAGKTTIIKALGAALAAQDIGPDAIRIGKDRAEILIDLDDPNVRALQVRRTITAKGSTLSITDRDGMKAPSPAKLLADVLGVMPFDAMAFYLAKPAARKAMVLEALPIALTMEDLRKWAPGLPEMRTDLHGLEVLERARKDQFDRRTEANRTVDTLKRNADRLRTEAEAIVERVRPDVLPIADASARHDQARVDLLTLEARAREAAGEGARNATTRARIAAARTEAAGLVVPEVTPFAYQGAAAAHEAALALALDAETTLAALRADAERLGAERQRVREAMGAQTKARRRRAELNAQADELEAALGEGAVEISPERIGLAREAFAAAHDALAAAHDAQRAADMLETASESLEQYQVAARAAQALDEAVRALTHDAPKALLATVAGLPGLALEGDDITLDGVKLDALCGAQQMRFAVEVARRLNVKSKLLIVDGLERIDPEQRDAFIAMATADGWQLIATLVDRGEPVFAAIELEAEAER